MLTSDETLLRRLACGEVDSQFRAVLQGPMKTFTDLLRKNLGRCLLAFQSIQLHPKNA